MRRTLLVAAVLAVLLAVAGAERAEACGGWFGGSVALAYPPCAPAYAPPAYYGYPPVYAYPPAYAYGPWPPPIYPQVYGGPAYWYYRSLRRDDWYYRPRIQGYTLR